ncbi:hypothetical protein H6G33_35275 [Calothrix sp. FACHB-1219]|uniref:hypothetical protein n=1 Tax=unclassified Calothrix TaxID=2619626 RepID=UPI0016883EA4|nr:MULTISPECIES: hypothetical protein [unclassified Calothrix]MBD2207595.1 hypothetical protein [Calothrix sp. FACHB-168]MBD2222196.1 hypothetical protein [Calothrix sp. FACHB-1219]
MKKNKLDNLKHFEPMGDESLAKQPLCVKVPVKIDSAIRALPNKSDWLRRVITDAAFKEGLCSEESLE